MANERNYFINYLKIILKRGFIMGVDGTNMLVILGPSATLDIIENGGIILSDNEVNNDKNLISLKENYFGKNCKMERGPKVLRDAGKKRSNMLKIRFNYRNKEPDEYLNFLIQKFKDCWIKNEYVTEIGACGIWIGEYFDDKLKIQTLEWYESPADDMSGGMEFD